MAEDVRVKCVWRVGDRKSDWFSELARKLHQPTNESQTRAEHVMQSRSNTAQRGGKKRRQAEE